MTKRPLRSLRNSDSFKQFVLDQLEGLDVRAKAMFGGVGLYSGEHFFGIIARDVLYLKVDAVTRRKYEEAGAKPFAPYKGRPTTMKYYEVPLTVLESAVELEAWAREAVSVARRTTEGKSGS